MKKSYLIFFFLLLIISCEEKNSSNKETNNKIIINEGESFEISKNIGVHYDTLDNGHILQFLLDPVGQDTLHKIIYYDSTIIENSGDYCLVMYDDSNQVVFDFHVYSVLMPGLSKNIVIMGHIDTNVITLKQQFSNNTFDKIKLNIPDSLKNKLEYLNACVIYFDFNKASKDGIDFMGCGPNFDLRK
jgi:hypothetical protein